MKLVIIHGPPAVGKLTTARALAALTGFRVFHNHLTFDLVKSVFDFPTPAFARLAETVRLAAIEAAARENLPGLIVTFAYASPEDDAFVEKIVEVVERHRGELAVVRLFCDPATHERRVVADERRRYGKLTSAEALRGALARWNFAPLTRAGEPLAIDNSTLDADAVARRIASHFGLPPR